MILKLEDIKKENIKLKEQLVNPSKPQKIEKPEQKEVRRTERSRTPVQQADNKNFLKAENTPMAEPRSKSRNKEVPRSVMLDSQKKEEVSAPKSVMLDNAKPKLISMVSIGKDINDFTDLKRATLNKLKVTTLEAIGSKENEIKARFLKRIEEIKPQVDKFQNLIHKLKEDKYERLVKNSSSVFEEFEGTVSKKQEMFFKKIFLMHVDLIEDYDSYYYQLNQFQSLSSDFQKYNVS